MSFSIPQIKNFKLEMNRNLISFAREAEYKRT